MPRAEYIKLRAGTLAEWTAANPILAAKEPGYITDTGELRVGDGVTAFLSLTGLFGLTRDANGRLVTNDDLVIGGTWTTFHDFHLIPAKNLDSNGTYIPATATVAGVPRWSLLVGQRVKFALTVPFGWTQVSINILWTKEVAASGNVHFNTDYDVINFLSGDTLTGAATTNVDNGAVAVPGTVGNSTYTIMTNNQAIPTPTQLFNLPALLLGSITRIDDATDTYGDANAIGVAGVNISRTSA